MKGAFSRAQDSQKNFSVGQILSDSWNNRKHGCGYAMKHSPYAVIISVIPYACFRTWQGSQVFPALEVS